MTYKQNDSSVYVQLELGKEPHFMGDCINLDDIPNPQGGTDLLQCWSRDRQSWVVRGEKPTPPGSLDFTIENLLDSARSWLDRVKGPFWVYALKYPGLAGVFKSWEVAAIAQYARLTDDPLGAMAHRETADESTHSYNISARPPRITLWRMTSGLVTTTEAEDLLCLAMPLVFQDGVRVAPRILPCDLLMVGAAAAAGLTANTHYSRDGGTTLTVTGTDPFAADENIISMVSFQIETNVRRFLCVRDGDAANPLEVAFSDDNGATWTVATVGTTNNEAATGPKSLCALDQEHIWLCTDDGNVFFSDDGGVTWTDQNALGASGANALNAISFADENNGWAVGAADTVIRTTNGGTTWNAASATGMGTALSSVQAFTQYRALIGGATLAAGPLMMTFDGGVTYETKYFTGYATESVADIDFIAPNVGLLVTNTAGPVGSVHQSIDGGHTWEEIGDIPTNLGLNAVKMCDPNEAFVVGNTLASAIAAVVHLSA